MNKVQTVINIILLAAVATLGILQFKTCSKSTKVASNSYDVIGKKDVKSNDTSKGASVVYIDTNKKDETLKEFKIAYFNSDLLEDNLNIYKRASQDIKSMQQASEAKIERARNEFQDYYRKLTNSKTQATEEETKKVMELEENVKRKMAEEQQSIAEKSSQLNKNLRDRVESFLERYNKTKGYAYIIQYVPDASFIFLKNNSFDITADLINGINAE
jgi:outer membrane protein